MASMLFTLPNSVDLAGAGLSAGSTAPGSDVANLRYPQITSPWRSAADLVPGVVASPLGYPGSRWLQYSAPPVQATIDSRVAVVALVADAARPVIGGLLRKWRARAYGSSFGSPLSIIVRPVAFAPNLFANLVGAPSASVWLPATSWLTAISPTANTDARWQFDLPQTDHGLLPLKPGANLQTFNIWCRRSGSGGTDPTLSVDLFEAGVFTANLASGIAITRTGGQLVQVSWNASLLATGLSTTQAGLRLTGVHGSTQTVEFSAVEWQAEHNGYLADSGDLVIAYPQFVTTQVARVFNLAWVLPTPVSVAGAGGTVLVDQVDLNGSPGYAQAGRLVVADAVQPFVNMDYGWGISWEDKSPVSETPGGQEWFEVRPKRRIGELVCNSLRDAEAWDEIFSQQQGSVGITGNFLWIPDPAAPGKYYNQILWCRHDGLSPVKNPRFSRNSQSYKLKEVL